MLKTLLFTFFVLAFVNLVTVADKTLNSRLLSQKDNDVSSVVVSFTPSMDLLFKSFENMKFANLLEKRTTLYQLQVDFTNKSQSKLKRFLTNRGITFESFWITNQMHIPEANISMIRQIAEIEGVFEIVPEPVARLDTYLESSKLGNELNQNNKSVEWGIERIRANAVWGSYTGKGIVVANIDTGVRYTHETLRHNWRESYGWLDAFNGATFPFDNNGHGTHTMGTLIGNNGIGVAPGAEWIACKACDDRAACPHSQLIRCGQWIQCPTLPDGSSRDCSMAPHIASNSWGYRTGNQNYFDGVIKSWHFANIIPVFSIMNTGPNCGTACSPGDKPNVIGVGNLNISNALRESSSRGPTTDNRVKPDISAPGTNIRSAYHTGDTSYSAMTGTSMACPHVAGVIALMLEKNPDLNYEQIFVAITKRAVKDVIGETDTCGGTTDWPNNHFGYGRLDAVDLVAAVL